MNRRSRWSRTESWSRMSSTKSSRVGRRPAAEGDRRRAVGGAQGEVGGDRLRDRALGHLRRQVVHARRCVAAEPKVRSRGHGGDHDHEDRDDQPALLLHSRTPPLSSTPAAPAGRPSRPVIRSSLRTGRPAAGTACRSGRPAGTVRRSARARGSRGRPASTRRSRPRSVPRRSRSCRRTAALP